MSSLKWRAAWDVSSRSDLTEKVLLEAMMKTKSLCWINVVSLFCLIAMGSQAMALDLSSPRATVHSFVGSLNQYNFKQAAMCVDGADPEKAVLFADWESDFKRIHLVFTLSNLHSTVNNSTAVVTSTVTLKPREAEDASSVAKSSLKLIRHNNEWKLIPDSTNEFERIGGNQDFLGYVAAYLAHPEAFDAVRKAAITASCQSNLKQLSQALQTLIKDHDNTFALTNSTLHQELQAYVRSDALYYCPVVSGDDEKEPSYSFNDNLANMTQAAIKNPATTIMLYEGKDGKLDFRHNGKANVAFADGHVKAVDAEAAKSLLWQP